MHRMRAETALRPTETWLACPSTLEQTDDYWQAVSMCRVMGIELELHPLVHPSELPWERLRCAGHWQGLVLWPDATGQRLCRLAEAHGVRVRRLVLKPRNELQPWSGD